MNREKIRDYVTRALAISSIVGVLYLVFGDEKETVEHRLEHTTFLVNKETIWGLEKELGPDMGIIARPHIQRNLNGCPVDTLYDLNDFTYIVE